MSTSETCAFCRVAAGEDEAARVVCRLDGVVAFFPDEPATPGHTLLIPTRHVERTWELAPDEAVDLSRATVLMARMVQDIVAPEGLNVIQSNGRAASQSIAHLHVHLVPRWEGDALGQIWPETRLHQPEDEDHALARLRAEAEHRSA